MSLSLPRCMFCKFFHEEKEELCCDAFPDSIPSERLGMSDESDEECNNGIKYEHK